MRRKLLIGGMHGVWYRNMSLLKISAYLTFVEENNAEKVVSADAVFFSGIS
jgi:hypothetical protein